MVLHSYDAAQSKQFSLNAISGRGPGECRRALGNGQRRISTPTT